MSSTSTLAARLRSEVNRSRSGTPDARGLSKSPHMTISQLKSESNEGSVGSLKRKADEDISTPERTLTPPSKKQAL